MAMKVITSGKDAGWCRCELCGDLLLPDRAAYSEHVARCAASRKDGMAMRVIASGKDRGWCRCGFCGDLLLPDSATYSLHLNTCAARRGQAKVSAGDRPHFVPAAVPPQVQPVPRGFWSILWQNLRGELRRDAEVGRFEGVATFLAARGGRMLLTGLGPFGSLLAELVDPLMRAIVGSVRQWAGGAEWQRGFYRARATRSGLVVLERPEIIAGSTKLALPARTLELPTNEIIRPTPNRIFTPAEAGVSSPSGPPTTLFKQVLAAGALKHFDRRLLRTPAAANLRQLNDVQYPGWLFTRSADTASGAPFARRQAALRPRLPLTPSVRARIDQLLKDSQRDRHR